MNSAEDVTNKKHKGCSDEDGSDEDGSDDNSIDDERTEEEIEKEFRELQNKSQKLIVYTEYYVNINFEEDDGENFTDDIKNELENLNSIYEGRLKLNFIYSEEKGESRFHTGRIEGRKIKKIFKKHSPIVNVNEVFMCGPQQMTENIKDLLINKFNNK